MTARVLPLSTDDPRLALSRLMRQEWEPAAEILPYLASTVALEKSSPTQAVSHWARGEERAVLCRDRSAGAFFLVVLEEEVARVQG